MNAGTKDRRARASVFSVKPEEKSRSSAKRFVSIIKPSSRTLIVESSSRKKKERA